MFSNLKTQIWECSFFHLWVENHICIYLHMFLFPKEFHFFAIPGIPPLRGSCSPHHLLLLLVGYGLYLDIKIRKRCKTIYCSHCGGQQTCFIIIITHSQYKAKTTGEKNQNYISKNTLDWRYAQEQGTGIVRFLTKKKNKNLYLVSKEICSSRTMKSTKNSKKMSLVSYMKVNGKMLSMWEKKKDHCIHTQLKRNLWIRENAVELIEVKTMKWIKWETERWMKIWSNYDTINIPDLIFLTQWELILSVLIHFHDIYSSLLFFLLHFWCTLKDVVKIFFLYSS